MKTRITAIAIVIASFSLCFSACSNSGSKAGQEKTTAEVVYICPMDTQVTSNKPGKCPICGMDLVDKSTLKNKN